MPTESLPWDRKEAFLKDQKQERGVGSDAVGGAGGAGGGSCSTSRWREPYHGLRDCPRASPRRPLTGHFGYDAGYHPLYPEESSGHGCTPSRSGDKFCPEEENFRLSSGWSGGGGGKSSSNGGREGWCSSLRSPCLESSGDCARQHNFSPVTAQRSVAVPITYTFSSSSSPIPLKNFVDKSDGGVIDGLGTGQRYDRDHSLGSIAWKPLKWTRPSSLSMSKTVRPDSEETSLEISVSQVKQSPLSSPVMSSFPAEDRAPSKKPRLGWGQGLAKYEKQKVEGTVDFSGQNGSANSCKDFGRDSSPMLFALNGSTSPPTPTSANCSSSPACTDEKISIKVLISETDRTQSCDSSVPRVLNSQESISINLDGLDANSVSTLDLLLTDLMQPEEACSGDSSFSKHSTLNKLLLLKRDISKELEKTECDIDLFENKLKSINCDMQKNNYQECTYMTQDVGVAQSSLNSIDGLSEMLFSENCMVTSSVCLEGQQVVCTHLSEEHANETKDFNHNSSGTILCDVQLACSDRENVNSSNPQSDMCPVNNMDEKAKFPDAEHLVQPAMHLSADVCVSELYCSLDHIMKNSDDSSAAFILSSNKDTAKRASQEFDMAMPLGISQFNLWETDDILQCSKNIMHIRGKLSINKRMLKFKERALALKFRALHHLWKEDLNLLIMRKNRPKSNKRSEANIRLPQHGLQKHQSSARSRYALPAGSPTLVPTTEILNFTSKLLSDSQLRLYRSNLRMPAQIIDESERKYSRFYSYNGLIEDPSSFEKEKLMINPWVQDEKNIFLEMLSTFGKDFKKISSFIPSKTTADCVEFYYKNHKLESFTEVKRQLKLKKQWQSHHNNTYLITSGSRFNREANSASLELLGSAIIASESNCSKRNNQKQSAKVSRRSNGLLKESISEISGSEKETAAADVLAGICGALSSDAMSSCVTSSIDLPERIHFTMIDRSLTPEAAPQTIDEEETCSGESSDEMESADWTDEEKSMFIRAFNMFGRDFGQVANFVRTRSRDQCKIFFSKARKCLGLDVIQHGSTNGVTPTSDANEGRSGTDDACSTQSCSKMDADFTQSVLKTWNEGLVNDDNNSRQTDADKLCAQCEIDGLIPVEVDGKYDNKSSLLNEDKLEIKGGDVHGAVESFVDAQANNENTGNMLSPAKPVEANSEDKLKSRISLKAAVKVSEVDSNQLVVLSPDVDKLPHVKMEDSGALGISFFFDQSLHPNSNCCNVVEQKKNGYPSHVFSSTFKHQVPLEVLCSLPKEPHTKVEKPKHTVSCGPNCVLPNISSVFFDKADTESSISIFNMQVGGKCEQESIRGDSLAQDLLITPFPNLIDSPFRVAAGGSEILSQNHNKLKIDRKLVEEKSTIEIPAMDNRTPQSNSSLVPELKNDNCVGACVLNSKQDYESERYLMEDKSAAHQTTQTQFDSYAESEEHSHQMGDLKLFGQILSHPSSLKSSSQEVIKANVPILGSNSVLTNHLGELPQRSYGFWDGSRIQTGFSSLPESAIALAKYQVSSNGMPFRTSANSDYQQQAQMQSVSTEMKFLENFSPELQKRNGFDLLAGFQQQRRMVHLGVNMVSSGVSDPVAALQMHYSGRRAKILTGDLESLTGDM